MYIYNDKWMDGRNLRLINFSCDKFQLQDGRIVSTSFYDGRLRMLTAENIQLCSVVKVDDDNHILENFRTQYGEPLPGIAYLSISEFGSSFHRYFRIVRDLREYSFTRPRYNSIEDTYGRSYKCTQITYELAGLPGESSGILDDLYEVKYD